jgi:predicted RNA binding protein YcfA (HicA-like mRNA interferase family)
MVTILFRVVEKWLSLYDYLTKKEGGNMVMKVKEVINLLEEKGWEYQRTRGDHRIYYKKNARRPIVVPGNLNDDLKSGTQNSILREMNKA